MTRFRVDIFRNTGKKENGRRIILDSDLPWPKCIELICEKLKIPNNPNCNLYSESGILIKDSESILDGESLFFDENGGKFINIVDPNLLQTSTKSPNIQLMSTKELSFFQYALKFIVVGASGTGKSCLLLQFTDKRFNASTEPTIGVDFGTAIVKVRNIPMKLQIWDTAGQEDFRAICRAYYREAAGALLVYDVTSKPSYQKLQSWLSSVQKYATNANIVITLVGNKTDCSDRTVTYEEGEDFARKNNLDYIETSAKTGHNVDLAFIKTAEKIYEKITSGVVDATKKECGILVNTEIKAIQKSTVQIDAIKNKDANIKSGCC